MARKKTRVVAALARAEKTLTREVLSKALADLPRRTTMGEVTDSLRSGGFVQEFDTMTLADFVSAVGGSGRVASRVGRRAGTNGIPRQARKGGAKVNTRTASGRAQLDQAVSEFLSSGGPARAGGIRKAVGGTSHQVRQAVTRLIEAKKVSKKGQKRGTEYSWGSKRTAKAKPTKSATKRSPRKKKRASRKSSAKP